MWGVNPVTVFFMLVVALWLINSINVVREYERGVIFRLGRLLSQPKGPGLIFVFWPIDRIVRVSLRTITLDVPTQDIITSDNVSAKVNAVVYFRVVDATRAVVEVRTISMPPPSFRRPPCVPFWERSCWTTCSANGRLST